MAAAAKAASEAVVDAPLSWSVLCAMLEVAGGGGGGGNGISTSLPFRLMVGRRASGPCSTSGAEEAAGPLPSGGGGGGMAKCEIADTATALGRVSETPRDVGAASFSPLCRVGTSACRDEPRWGGMGGGTLGFSRLGLGFGGGGPGALLGGVGGGEAIAVVADATSCAAPGWGAGGAAGGLGGGTAGFAMVAVLPRGCMRTVGRCVSKRGDGVSGRERASAVVLLWAGDPRRGDARSSEPTSAVVWALRAASFLASSLCSPTPVPPIACGAGFSPDAGSGDARAGARVPRVASLRAAGAGAKGGVAAGAAGGGGGGGGGGKHANNVADRGSDAGGDVAGAGSVGPGAVAGFGLRGMSSKTRA